jgi:hypothetical protein
MADICKVEPLTTLVNTSVKPSEFFKIQPSVDLELSANKIQPTVAKVKNTVLTSQPLPIQNKHKTFNNPPNVSDSIKKTLEVNYALAQGNYDLADFLNGEDLDAEKAFLENPVVKYLKAKEDKDKLNNELKAKDIEAKKDIATERNEFFTNYDKDVLDTNFSPQDIIFLAKRFGGKSIINKDDALKYLDEVYNHFYNKPVVKSETNFSTPVLEPLSLNSTVYETPKSITQESPDDSKLNDEQKQDLLKNLKVQFDSDNKIFDGKTQKAQYYKIAVDLGFNGDSKASTETIRKFLIKSVKAKYGGDITDTKYRFINDRVMINVNELNKNILNIYNSKGTKYSDIPRVNISENFATAINDLLNNTEPDLTTLNNDEKAVLRIILKRAGLIQGRVNTFRNIQDVVKLNQSKLKPKSLNATNAQKANKLKILVGEYTAGNDNVKTEIKLLNSELYNNNVIPKNLYENIKTILE